MCAVIAPKRALDIMELLRQVSASVTDLTGIGVPAVNRIKHIARLALGQPGICLFEHLFAFLKQIIV